MSSAARVPMRDRWRARSMIVRKWLAHGKFQPGDPLCEIETDGVVSVVKDTRLHPEDYGGIYHYFVAEGAEVPPSGLLLEYGDSLGGGDDRLHQSAYRPLVRRKEYPRFFLSYRREDSEPYAWRLHESMSGTWGAVDVFMDQFSINPGEVFPWVIQQAAIHAKTMIVLIGPKWFEMKDERGSRRLFDEHDYVHREICAALDRGTLVVPILLPGADIPERHSLPDGLQGITELQFFPLSARHWSTDLGQLRDYLDQYFKDVLKFTSHDTRGERNAVQHRR